MCDDYNSSSQNNSKTPSAQPIHFLIVDIISLTCLLHLNGTECAEYK